MYTATKPIYGYSDVDLTVSYNPEHAEEVVRVLWAFAQGTERQNLSIDRNSLELTYCQYTSTAMNVDSLLATGIIAVTNAGVTYNAKPSVFDSVTGKRKHTGIFLIDDTPILTIEISYDESLSEKFKAQGYPVFNAGFIIDLSDADQFCDVTLLTSLTSAIMESKRFGCELLDSNIADKKIFDTDPNIDFNYTHYADSADFMFQLKEAREQLTQGIYYKDTAVQTEAGDYINFINRSRRILACHRNCDTVGYYVGGYRDSGATVRFFSTEFLALLSVRL